MSNSRDNGRSEATDDSLASAWRAFRAGHYEQAEEGFEAILRKHPRDPGACDGLATLAAMAGVWEDAVAWQTKVVHYSPGSPSVLHRLGLYLGHLGRRLEAAGQFSEACRLGATHPGQWQDAVEMMRLTGHADLACSLAREGMRRFPAHAGLKSNYLVALSYTSVTASDYAREARRIGEQWAGLFQTGDKDDWKPQKRPQSGNLRLGWYSGDWGRHATAAFFYDLLPALSDLGCHHTLFHDGSRNDDWTTHFKGVANDWHVTANLTVDGLRRLMRQTELDVIFDIPGHFGVGRPELWASRVATLQIHWLGHAGTTGLPQLDYRIADTITEPPMEEIHSTERIIRLNCGSFTYRPVFDSGRGQQAPDGSVLRLGTCTAPAKWSSRTLDFWAAILRALPSVTLLIGREELAETMLRDWLFQRFQKRGIGSDRLVVESNPDTLKRLTVYASIDVALDSLDYNGVTTTCDALHCGVPVLTLPGERYINRTTASLLSRVGLDDWVCPNFESAAGKVSACVEDLAGFRSRRPVRVDCVRRSVIRQAAPLARELLRQINLLASGK
jgi:protein O-GlcNAc transferase